MSFLHNIKRGTKGLLVLSGFARNPRREKQLATEWCAERAISTTRALVCAVGEYNSFFSTHAEEYERALVRERECPVSMGGAGNLELIYQLAQHVKAVRVVETGVAYGWSSFALLLSLRARGGQLISTDRPYSKFDSTEHVGVVVPSWLRKNWTLLRGADKDVLSAALIEPIDLCHYDSDKTYEGRMWAYPRLWEALHSGGIFISDDVGDNFAFRDFCSSLRMEPTIVERDTPHLLSKHYVGFIIKP